MTLRLRLLNLILRLGVKTALNLVKTPQKMREGFERVAARFFVVPEDSNFVPDTIRRNGDSGVALVNMGSTPVLATSVSSALAGGASIEDAAEQAAAEAEPQADLNASVEYRTHLAKVLVKRALTEASG